MSRGTEALSTFTNLSLWLAAYYAWEKERFMLVPILFVEGVFSTLYHLCKSYSGGGCLLPYSTLHDMDFFLATSVVWTVCSVIIRFPYKRRFLEYCFIWIGPVTIFFLLVVFPGNFLPILIFSGVSIGVLATYIALYFYNSPWIAPKPRFNWFRLTIGVQFLVLASSLYIIQSYLPNYYWFPHSLWHLLGGIGLSFMIKSRPSQGKEWKEDVKSSP